VREGAGEIRRPVAQPLHEQIRLLLLERIEAAEWPPGTYLPSEARLASDYGVAVGTLRTALNALAGEGILIRRQGRGTAVATHDADRALFRFFTLQRPDGTRLLPVSRPLSRARRPATPEEAEDLRLAPSAGVVHISRLREIDGRVTIVEDITLDAARFGRIAKEPEVLPNTLYDLYQKAFGATVTTAEERLEAVGADGETAQHLTLPAGYPILRILRVARDWQGTPVERRVSRVNTEGLCYRSQL
jgi:GntR family transcriptional regulator